MNRAAFIAVSAVLASTISYAQDTTVPDTKRQAIASAITGDSSQSDGGANSSAIATSVLAPNQSDSFGVGAKFRYYLGETYLNPSFITAPAFRAGIRMASPPGHSPTAYPRDWSQGAAGFERNFGDALAQRVTFQTARFVTGTLIREDPRYVPSSSHNVFVRSLHAFGCTFIDRSDSGHRMPAFSNFVGASAAGFVGNAYLPPGFDNATHAGQRAALQFGFFGAGNLFREFAPQMPRPLRIFIQLIGR